MIFTTYWYFSQSLKMPLTYIQKKYTFDNPLKEIITNLDIIPSIYIRKKYGFDNPLKKSQIF